MPVNVNEYGVAREAFNNHHSITTKNVMKTDRVRKMSLPFLGINTVVLFFFSSCLQFTFKNIEKIDSNFSYLFILLPHLVIVLLSAKFYNLSLGPT